MSIMTLNAKLDRTDNRTPWGFRLHGGIDFGAQLSIQRVNPGSLAAKCGVQVGDAIMKIGGAPTDGMKHKDAQQQIMSCGNSLELTLQRGGGLRAAAPAPAPAPAPVAPPPAAAPSLYQQPSNKPFGQGYKPFASSGPKPYGSPNVDGLANQTSQISIGQSQPASAPWRSQPGGMSPAAPKPAPAPAPVAPSTWQPKIPVGPRTPKVGRKGDARSMPGVGGGARIPICSACGSAIRGPFVTALDKTWCPDHFLCANPQCRVQLIDMEFVVEDGQLFCIRDYEQYFAPRCGKCGQAIVGDYVTALDGYFHPACFVCTHCRQPINAGAYHMHDGEPYCTTDWAALYQTKCYGCNFPIEPGDKWVEALSQNWHSECFNCATCQVSLEGQSFFAKGGRPYCKRHAQ